MAAIAIVHPDLEREGGAGAVCMNAIEALQDRHDLTVLTFSQPDLGRLNEYYNTNVEDVTVRRVRGAVRAVDALFPIMDTLAGLQPNTLKEVVFHREVRRIEAEFDLVVCTRNEFRTDAPSIQYIHFPRLGLIADGRPGILGPVGQETPVHALYDRLCLAIEGFDRSQVAAGTVLTNSEWTAGIIEEQYGVLPQVVYPPIDVEAFDPQPWARRENGFVTIGRIRPEKDQLRMIEIVSRLREQGHDVHLHIVGPPGEGTYTRRVEQRAAGELGVRLDGKVPRKRLVELITTHRYGLHATEYEHFGMAVAELVAGGTVPFVPASGGQTDIVDHHDLLTYSSIDEATANIARVLADESQQATLRETLEASVDRYHKNAFQRRLRSAVEKRL